MSWFVTYVYFASFIGFPACAVGWYCEWQIGKTTSTVNRDE